jgi:hypothetical protein
VLQAIEVRAQLLADMVPPVTINVTRMMSYGPGELYRGLQTEAVHLDKFKKYACKKLYTPDLPLSMKSSSSTIWFGWYTKTNTTVLWEPEKTSPKGPAP